MTTRSVLLLFLLLLESTELWIYAIASVCVRNAIYLTTWIVLRRSFKQMQLTSRMAFLPQRNAARFLHRRGSSLGTRASTGEFRRPSEELLLATFLFSFRNEFNFNFRSCEHSNEFWQSFTIETWVQKSLQFYFHWIVVVGVFIHKNFTVQNKTQTA